MKKISGSAFRWTLGLLLLLQFPLSVFSQETGGSLSGRVTDTTGAPMEGATIMALHTSTGTKYGVMAGKDGRYFLNNLRIGGPYTVTATMMGMGVDTREDVVIRLGGSLQLDLVLKGSSRQLNAVTVAAYNGKARTDNYGTGKNISSQQIRNMPTVSRSITDITRLTPQGSRDNSFGGTNFRYNNVTIDGAVNNDAIGFSPSLGGQTGTSGMAGSSTRTNPVSLDAIADMQVYLAPYDVKIGNFTGGSVNAVTRSGTNRFSGSVYGFGRNAAITGKDRVGSLGKMNSDFHEYQAGFRVGFPIIQNKLFFFSNEEITSRQDPSQLSAGIPETARILSKEDATTIAATVKNRYGDIFDAGTAGVYNNWNRSQKFFNRVDWNINDKHQLAIRNNTILSKATHMDRDQQDFRFSSMAFQQTNNQSSTVAELKSRFSNRLSGNLVAGFTMVNDKRDPLSDPSLPQVQIMGRAPGTTIYLGTDREASIFNMRQQTWEFTANVNYVAGRHKILAGTHNELYNIRYGFVNSWNGRVDYSSIDDFIANNPFRVRGSYNYINNTRDYILSHPAAKFNVNMYSLYLQDEIQVSDRLQVTPGLRADFTHLPTAPVLSDKVKDILTDPKFGTTYTYTPLNRITNNFLNSVQISPRIGFRYDVLGDRSLILRGGAGLFTGRIPFAWLAYAYYNTGDSYGAFDQRADQKPFTPGSDAIRPGPNGIGSFIEQNGAVINNPNSGKTQVDLVDNHFVLPQVLRTSVGIDYEAVNDWRFTVEAMYTRNIKDVLFQQLNTKDNPYWFGYDTARKQPVYSGTVDPRFSNTYLLSNTNQGYRYSVTGTVSKRAGTKWEASASYTYGESKDLSNGVRNSMESNWQLNQAMVPNNPALSHSNFDIRHRIIASVSYNQEWKAAGKTNISLFFSAQSGSPFTYGIVNNSIQGLPQQVSLVYIPQRGEAVSYFKDLPEKTVEQQADAFNRFIDDNKYLNSRRGRFTERNEGRTPWNIQADLHVAHDLFVSKNKSRFITITADVMNLTNLLNKSWGIQYFSPNTFNSTSSVGLTPVLFPPQQNKDNYPVFIFDDPGKPYSVDYFGSRVQMQVGVRYTFQ
ncbi:TonB-dependent receptor [Chitinophaga arvensicola]|uniref:Carboxypeptidase regulatory-like domain-containing protein n=1 Tax=Chitinophaga arvensicola TaxID=29529 RepID=A0A1I0S7E5_9BACT|nr:carboxypeptidase regulatory-like domain-containing protein [Chitinophaga arvensicola]SEW51606.1 Carboxypeptidase regulatory-like domain-containing protein [Chitinophaga arvensicola]